MNVDPPPDDSWPQADPSKTDAPRTTQATHSFDFLGHSDWSAVSVAAGATQATSETDQPSNWPRIPGYEIEALIGRGGMGVVFRARQVGLDRTVALKMILDAGLATPAQKIRFQIEAENAARVQHPNIVQVFDVGEHQGQPFFALEYVQGGSLADWLKRHRPSPSVAARLVETLARAMHAAHLHGIVHRDLKPDNVLLVAGDGELVPKIADFGLAKRLDRVSGLTGSDAVMGTPLYMAPEQAQGKNHQIGPTADQFALGVIFYQLLTGSLPLVAESIPELLLKIIATEPLPPRQLDPTIPLDLQVICLKCLEKDPQRRYATAAALADDLQNWREHRPVTARPATRLERMSKWCRRYPAATALIAVSVLAALLSGSLAWWAVAAERVAAAERDERARALLLVQAERDEKDQQRRAAEQARNEAETSELETRAVLDFVESRILATARPKDQEGGLGSSVALRDAIHAALPYLETSFKDQPLIEARLRMTIGTSFAYLGQHDLAETMYQRARHLFELHVGAVHPSTLASMHNLASCYAQAGRHAEALRLREETWAKRKALRGPDHVESLGSANAVANSYESLGQYRKALPLREQVLQGRTSVLGPHHSETLDAMQNLANCYANLGRLQDALRLFTQALDLQRAHVGPDHPSTLRTMHNLAIVHSELGQHDEAFKFSVEVVARRQEVLGPEHPDTLSSMHSLVITYFQLGRKQEALALCEKTLRLRQAKLGPDHADTLSTQSNLAVSYFSLGRFAEALALHEEAFRLRRDTLGPDHPDTLFSMSNLAGSYAQAGRHQEALTLREEALRLRQAKLGLDHPVTLGSMQRLATSYAELQRHEEALSLRKETLRLRRARLGPHHPDTLLSLSQYGESLVATKQMDEAMPFFTEAVTQVLQQKLVNTSAAAIVAEAVGAGEAAGQWSLAESWQRQWIGLLTEKLGASSLEVCQAQLELGALLLKQKKLAEAEPTMIEAYSLTRKQAAASGRLNTALDRLVELYTAQGNAAEAAKWSAERERLEKPLERGASRPP
ncbi:MAG TPA: serine/threonine-protein kinase [Gemmatales bacterium]|nr:serine/threonine-protein kinase [Gemmatales bacterium]HMP57900.1 serine/threonine-protein kinase [Gemmatales bacterium]